MPALIHEHKPFIHLLYWFCSVKGDNRPLAGWRINKALNKFMMGCFISTKVVKRAKTVFTNSFLKCPLKISHPPIYKMQTHGQN